MSIGEKLDFDKYISSISTSASHIKTVADNVGLGHQVDPYIDKIVYITSGCGDSLNDEAYDNLKKNIDKVQDIIKNADIKKPEKPYTIYI